MVLGLVVKYWDSQAMQVKHYYESLGFEVYIIAHEAAKACVKDNGENIIWVTKKWMASKSLEYVTLEEFYESHLQHALVRLLQVFDKDPVKNGSVVVVRDDCMFVGGDSQLKSLLEKDFYAVAKIKKGLFGLCKVLEVSSKLLIISKQRLSDFSDMVQSQQHSNFSEVAMAYLNAHSDLIDAVADDRAVIVRETVDLFDLICENQNQHSATVHIYSKVVDLFSYDPWVWLRDGTKVKGLMFAYANTHVSKRHAIYKVIELAQKEMHLHYNLAMGILIKTTLILQRDKNSSANQTKSED